MKRTIRKNVTDLPYGLHDMHVTGLTVSGNDITFKFADGFTENRADGKRVGGEICFCKADLDFCFVYVIDICGNLVNFVGRKYSFAHFAAENAHIDFEIIDETYGYNSSKFFGLLRRGETQKECNIEIYHLGEMEYLTEE